MPNSGSNAALQLRDSDSAEMINCRPNCLSAKSQSERTSHLPSPRGTIPEME